MNRILSILAVAILAGTCLSALAEDKYTCQASVLMWDTYAKRPEIVSPDGSKHIRLWSSAKDPEPESAKFYASIYSGTHLLRTVEVKDLSAATFVKWSADSKAFYVMWSDGGAIGGYHVRVFIVSGDQATESPAPKSVAADFAQHHYCKTRGNNLLALRWEGGSQQLLFKAQVYPTSDCGREMGFTRGYLVDLATGEIKRQYTDKEIDALAKSCPSVVLPSALARQEDVDSAVPVLQGNASLESAFASFAECLETKKRDCISSYISNGGVSVGVDGTKLTKQALTAGLRSDSSLRCVFWGGRCNSKESANCSLSNVTKGAPRFGKAYLYKGTWQAEVTAQGTAGTCATTTSFIFQLENGAWKLVAIPYT